MLGRLGRAGPGGSQQRLLLKHLARGAAPHRVGAIASCSTAVARRRPSPSAAMPLSATHCRAHGRLAEAVTSPPPSQARRAQGQRVQGRPPHVQRAGRLLVVHARHSRIPSCLQATPPVWGLIIWPTRAGRSVVGTYLHAATHHCAVAVLLLMWLSPLHAETRALLPLLLLLLLSFPYTHTHTKKAHHLHQCLVHPQNPLMHAYMTYMCAQAATNFATTANGVLASTFLLYSVGLGAGAIPTAGALNWCGQTPTSMHACMFNSFE